MKPGTNRLLRLLITGALAALPLAATLLVVGWMLAVLIQVLGPNSAVGSVFSALGLGVGGSELMGYLLGLALVLLMLIALGALVELGLQRGVARLIDRIFGAIPLVRTIWDLAKRLAGLLDRREDQALKSMAPVWVQFGEAEEGGPRRGVVVLALLSNPQAVMVKGQPCLAVIVPTAPIPVGGGLLFVPQAWVTPAEIGMEALTSLYVSMGVTVTEYLPLGQGDTKNPEPNTGRLS
jgi:uncharacterized membrane protein